MSTMRQKTFDEKVKTLPATDILCTTFFDTWVFLNQRTAPFWLITALWDRISWTEYRVTAHLCIKAVGAPNLLIHWRFPHENVWHCETISFDKTMMPPPLCENFRCQDCFQKPKSSHTKFFRPLWQNSLTEPWCPPPLHENFGTMYFFETQNGSPTNFLGAVKRKYVDRKSWCRSPFSSNQNFISIPESFWNDEGFPNEVFQRCETIFFSKNLWYSLLCLKNFLYQFFFEMQNGSPTSFLGVMRHKELFHRTVMSPPLPPGLPMHGNFRHQKFFEIQMFSPTRFIVSVKKNSTVNGEILFWCKKNSIPEFFRKTEWLNGYTTKFIGFMRHK